MEVHLRWISYQQPQKIDQWQIYINTNKTIIPNAYFTHISYESIIIIYF